MNEITQSELKSLLSYDLETGVFFWIAGHRFGKIAGWSNGNGYLRIGIKGKQYFCHRLAWLYVHGELPKVDTDHINGIRNDNRIVNLRACSTSENMRNVGIRPNNTSGFKGVDFHKATGKWRSRLRVDGKEKHFGLFLDPELASEVYEANARQSNGQFYRKSK